MDFNPWNKARFMEYRTAVNLSCTRSGGANIAAEDFVALLSFAAEDKIEDTQSDLGIYRGSFVEFPLVFLGDYSDAEEPTEAYAAAVQEHLLTVAAFLDRQEAAIFEKFRVSGLRVYVYLEVRMDQNQMTLKLPVAFLSACARLGLGIEMISNDIPAAEAEEMGWR